MDGKKDFLKENLNKLLGLNNSCKAASKIFNITKEKRVSKEKSDVSSESKESEFTSNMNQIAAWNLKDIIGIKKIADDYIKNSFFNDRHIHVNQDPQDIHRAPSYNTYVNSLTDNEQRCSANIYDELKLLYVNKQKNQNKFQELERETQKVSSKPESFIKLLNNESILENVNFFSTIKSKNCLKLEPNESKEETCNPFNLNFFNNFNPVSDNEKSLYEEDSLNFHDYGMFK